MGKGGYKFIIVLICGFFSQKLYGQIGNKKIDFLFDRPSSSVMINGLTVTDSIGQRAVLSRVLQPDHYVKNLAFFCRQEWKVEKVTGLPLRLRIGSLEQCNRLEGK